MSQLQSQFLLNPNITYLNFGSFGACPKPVFSEYQNKQRELEEEPVQFMAIKSLKYLKQSREALANYINCEANDLFFLPNPSFAINTILKSIGLTAGEEILTTDLEYGACDKAWDYYCSKSGAVYKRQHITLPLTTKEKFLEEFFEGLTNKTKVIFLSQITSSTALIFPVMEVITRAKEKNILTVIDGAHVPGQLNLDLKDLGADIYTGACHKWMLTAKGCSFLYVKKEIQSQYDPLVVSWGYKSTSPSDSMFLDYHQMQGTRDISAFLTVPKAIEFMKMNNWEKISQSCRALVRANAEMFCNLLNTQVLAPITEEFIGQMLSLNIKCFEPEKLQSLLYEKYKIEIPVMRHGNKIYIRYSINAFNTQKDLDILYNALREIKSTTDLIQN